jgi:hypothetical protein
MLMTKLETHDNPIYQADATESVGIRHDVHCWFEQGHTVSLIPYHICIFSC